MSFFRPRNIVFVYSYAAYSKTAIPVPRLILPHFVGLLTATRVNLALIYQTLAQLPATHRVGSAVETYRDDGPRGMDDASTRRRQHGQHVQRTSSPRFALQEQPQQSRSLGGDIDRHRSSLLSSSSSTPRGMSAGGYSTYYQEPPAGFTTASMPTAAMGYSSEYSQDGRQSSHGFGGYNTATMMYNVPQAGAQGPVYDAQQYGSRQPPSTMQLMTPDVASTYFSSETGSGSASAMQPPTQSGAATTNVFQQTTPSMSYASNISGVSGIQQTPGSGGASVTDDNDYPDGALEEKWLNYQRQLGSIFQDIARGSLETASETLLSISKWLLPQVVDLGRHLFCMVR